VFFTNGGSESVEAAWKIVRQHYLAKGEPQRTKAIAREIAYHGVTLGALSFTGVRPMKEPFGASPIPVVRVSNTNAFRHELADDPAAHCAQLLEEMERTIVEAGPETVALIIAEPVQNAAGCLVPPEGYWAGLREIADKYGIALMADEVITGFGRIGEWFASSRFGPAPDVITVAKGLTSAYAPMGAVLVSDRIAEPLYDEGRMLLHGITFGGHPLAAAVALRNIEIFEREGVLENVREHEGYVRERLEELGRRVPIVGDVRGAGYFWALELVRDEDNTRFSAEERERLLRGFLAGRLLKEGLIARPDDRGDACLHLAPPLICGRPEIDEMVEKTEAVLADASERFFVGK
jgi:adenosylmethionine-8-amino-7-oxononanoate aminotransferase